VSRTRSSLRRASPAAAGAGWRWWQLLALPAAVLAVHQLRYVLAYGSRAASELSAHGDRYVSTAALVASTLVAISLAAGLVRLVAVSRGGSRPRIGSAPWWLLWLGLTVALVAGYWALEGLEAAFEPEHAGGVASAFAEGGFWALPAAALVAAVLTAIVRGGRLMLAVAARGRLTHRRAANVRGRPRPLVERALCAPMAGCAPGRAPPAAVLEH
jgi:hypothetical protein